MRIPSEVVIGVACLVPALAMGQDATIYEIGDPGPTSSVSPQGVSHAREAVGSVGGQVFIFKAGTTFNIDLPGDVQTSNGNDMSAEGIAVGRFRILGEFNDRAYLLNGRTGAFQELGMPISGDPFGVRANAISDDGEMILGEAQNYDDGVIQHVRRPVFWTDAGGAAVDYGSNDLVFTSINDINNLGEAVGTARYADGPNIWRGFARIGGVWVDIGGLGGDRTDAFAINNHGIVTGRSDHPIFGGRAFRWDPDTMEMEELLPPIGFSNARGFDINDAGMVVGAAGSDAMYWPPGEVVGRRLSSLLPPGSGWSRLSYAWAVDDCGVVVGSGTRSDRPGYNSGFMMVLPGFDQDGDGIADCWERDGVDIDGDGMIDLDLPAMGADPMRKDLFVEIDAMAGRAPGAAVLSRVVTAFANAPVDNPDGSTGITLHTILDETNLTRRGYPNSFGDFSIDKGAHFGTIAERGNANSEQTLGAKQLVFRYCIFGESYGGTRSSGLAELGGNDFMVTLGTWSTPGGTPDQQAGTFMHELGHTLGLQHGGGDGVNYKPNYYSLMNYHWQYPRRGYASSWRLDYSSSALPNLDEGSLFEQIGLGGAADSIPPILVPFRASDGTARVAPTIGPNPIDWSNNGVFDAVPVASDLNRFPASAAASPGDLLTGHDDWASLTYGFLMSRSFADGVHETVDELTEDLFTEIEDELAAAGCLADVAEPLGVLDIDDVLTYLAAFDAGEALADVAAPTGVFDIDDVLTFLIAFSTGCP